jgi:ketosteroid isomerase-like protein
MSQENVEVVRHALEAWNRDDVDAALLFIHPNAEWRQPPDLFLGLGSAYHGHTGVREWWKVNKEPWEYFKAHIERAVEVGDKVVTGVRFEAVGRESGAKVELPFANVWELRGGLIVRFTAYYSLEEALEAVGLRE